MNKPLYFCLFVFLGLNGVAQDLNLSFEDIDTSGLPTNWLVQTFPSKSALIDDAYRGAKAMRIVHNYFYVPGNSFLGDYIKKNTSTLVDLGEQGSLGMPIQQKVKSLKGWYKYEKVDPSRVTLDSGQVIVFLRRFLEVEQKSVIVGQGLLNLGKTENYTEFTVPIHYLRDLEPDTISIFFTTVSINYALNPLGGIKKLYPISSTHCASEFGRECLYLTIDDLSLQFTTPTQHPSPTLQNLYISPNPARDQALISWEIPDKTGNFSVQINDAFGRNIRTVNTPQNQVQVDTGDLPSGVYLVYLRQQELVIGVERLVVTK
ncbi:T9SS type A sorting domain-containing protein [Haliscomenobacter hydrossis]|uniref:Secretion system C-terminal sorting domain-containing protein n=1 Tax=Haliscomenobacter hydrossis (strain ATCC 27775 / DSM 1100 / LMG 10767 / O) TaxID=760192 RepID=F4L5W1_HALH1|nr:T9SS type A sorting domain-containing protein [Haliscomenobacter hydrossis]AEE52071.1 hypothetical protein Halhy_4226 [Haliscomenobacter hydrossis DSM 1100]